jgi:RNA polymerase sigma-70 factor (ECF subfamily)
MEREELLQSALAGDINAFQKLFAEFQSQLKSYVYRLLTSRNDVDDITQDTLSRHLVKYRPLIRTLL